MNTNVYLSFLENNKITGISVDFVRAKHLREISLSKYFVNIATNISLGISHFANSIQMYRGK